MKARNAASRTLAAGLAVACIHPLARGAAIEDLKTQARASFDALGAPRPVVLGSRAPAAPVGASIGQVQDRPSAPMPVGTVFRLKEPRTVFAGQTTVLKTADEKVECRFPAVSDALDTRLEAMRLVRSAAVGFRLRVQGDSYVGDFFAAGDQAFLERENIFMDQPARVMFQRYSFAMNMAPYGGTRIAAAIARAAQGIKTASFEFNKVKDDGSADPGITVRMDCVKHLPPNTASEWTFPQFAVPQLSELDGLFTVTAAPPQ